MPLSPITLSQPTHLAVGNGCRHDCGDYLRRVGARSLLLVTTSPIRHLADPLAEELRAGGLAVRVLDDVPPEPAVSDFDRARTGLAGADYDTLVGLGGGSVLDVAKLLAALLGRAERVAEVFGIGRLGGRSRRLVCLPTTAGTGSEVSPNAILLDDADSLKKGVVRPWLVPDAAFVDPELTLTLPPDLTATTGIDALVHCIEAFANVHAHPVVDVHALEGMRRIGGHLLRAVRQGDDIEARGEVMLGALYGGLCLGPVNTAAVHALAYPLGGEFHLAHGLSNALLLGPVLRFNLPAAPERYAAVARALGIPDQGDPVATAQAGVARLEALCADCGLPQGIGACGVPRDAIPRLATAALTVTRLLRNNPRPLTQADAESIYERAF